MRSNEEFPEAEIEVYPLDLSDLASVRTCAEAYLASGKPLDILINNAAVMMCPLGKTNDGFEMQLGTNHFGHFLLTNLLLDKIKSSGTPEKPSRIVVVSSLGHRRGDIDFDDLHFETRPYTPLASYGQSKTANILFAQELDRQLCDEAKANGDAGPRVLVNSLHPGSIKTRLQRHMSDELVESLGGDKIFSKTVSEGAATTLVAAASAKVTQGGMYLSDGAPADVSPWATGEDKGKRLWEVSLKAVGL
eukprot:GABV01008719.1.p2 GENE.GABV01008719.1~~GABV01008719.1.p2  ORF type:complete len:248 (+),score=66.62 GABV01008719.1:309-1052(+)